MQYKTIQLREQTALRTNVLYLAIKLYYPNELRTCLPIANQLSWAMEAIAQVSP